MKACALCKMKGCPWDEIDSVPLCPDCLEGLAAGEIEAVKFSVIRSAHCCICRSLGAVRFVTVPLRTPAHMVTTLGFCPLHLRALVGRSLDHKDFGYLAVLLAAFGLRTYQVFLLHEAFYDQDGRAVDPVDSFY